MHSVSLATFEAMYLEARAACLEREAEAEARRKKQLNIDLWAYQREKALRLDKYRKRK